MSTHLLKHKATLFTSSACLPVPGSPAVGGRGGDKNRGPHGGSLGPKTAREPFSTRLRPAVIRGVKAIKAFDGTNLNAIVEGALLDAQKTGWRPLVDKRAPTTKAYRGPYSTSLEPHLMAFLRALSKATRVPMNIILEILIERELGKIPEHARYPEFFRKPPRDKSDAEWEAEMREMFGDDALDAPDAF